MPRGEEDDEKFWDIIGDGMDYYKFPQNKGNYIRNKLVRNKLLKSDMPDYEQDTLTIERFIDSNINTHTEFFKSNELYKDEEAKMVIRLFKRLVYMSIKKEYGYLKR